MECTASAGGRSRVWATVAAMLCAASVVCLAACGGKADASEQVLRVAVTNDGDMAKAAWDRATAAFEDSHPGWQVQVEVQEDSLYETVGLQGQLTGQTPPDIYLEWAGARLARKVRQGYAADLTAFLKTSGLQQEFPSQALDAARVDGVLSMVPFTADVSSVIWYDKALFAQVGVAPPRTWAELEAMARRFRQAGIVPFAVGNKDLWPGGNWLAHLVSRVVGEQELADALSGRSPLSSPAMISGLEYVARLQRAGSVNASANTLSDAEGQTLFFQGRAAMLPAGSWFVGIQEDEAPDLSMGWFNLPPVQGGAGPQDSVLAVITGLVLNACSAHTTQAEDFLKIVYSPEMTQAWLAADLSAVIGNGPSDGRSPLSQEMADLLTSGAPLVPPPDTGYSTVVAHEFYLAIAEVLDGARTPEEALRAAQDRLDLRRDTGAGEP